MPTTQWASDESGLTRLSVRRGKLGGGLPNATSNRSTSGVPGTAGSYSRIWLAWLQGGVPFESWSLTVGTMGFDNEIVIIVFGAENSGFFGRDGVGRCFAGDAC